VEVLVIRVLLADDQVLVRAGFRLLLESAGDIAVIGEAANGGVAVALAREHAPDVVLMDLHMPEVDGVTATRLIAGDPDLAATRVVVLTTFDDEETVFAALRAGASGFLVKDVEPAELLQAVRVVARGCRAGWERRCLRWERLPPEWARRRRGGRRAIRPGSAEAAAVIVRGQRSVRGTSEAEVSSWRTIWKVRTAWSVACTGRT
jgi:DNA-binding NarL/FixJ family response regulator